MRDLIAVVVIFLVVGLMPYLVVRWLVNREAGQHRVDVRKLRRMEAELGLPPYPLGWEMDEAPDPNVKAIIERADGAVGYMSTPGWELRSEERSEEIPDPLSHAAWMREVGFGEAEVRRIVGLHAIPPAQVGHWRKPEGREPLVLERGDGSRKVIPNAGKPISGDRKTASDLMKEIYR